MTIFDASATADGSSAGSAAAIVRMAVTLAFQGSTSLTGAGGVRQLASATFRGESSLEWDYFVDASAVASGSSSASATGSVRVGAKAIASGSSLFLYNTPLIIQGRTYFSVLPVVERHLPPLRAITLGPKTFRWLQPLQRGDLPILLCDRHAPIVPHRVTYSLIQVRPDGSRHYVGPRGRVPAAGETGEFYATGQAGEAGQPGQWVIEWLFQRSADALPEMAEMPFRVLDAVAVGDPRDRLDRKTKFGWS